MELFVPLVLTKKGEKNIWCNEKPYRIEKNPNNLKKREKIMNKMILALSPLLLSVLFPCSTAHGMKKEPKILSQEKGRQIEEKAKKASGPVFEQLLQHPRFIAASQLVQDELSKTVELEPEDMPIPAHMPQQLTTTTETPTATQEEVNFNISQIIQNTGLTADDEEDSENTPLKSGLCWALTLKSYMYSKPDLLIYTLDNSMFDADNRDHLALLDQAIMECTTNGDAYKLGLIIEKARHALADKVVLKQDTVDAAVNCIATQKNICRTTVLKDFARTTGEQQVLAKAVLEQFKKSQETAVQELVKGLNAISASENMYKNSYRTDNQQEQKVIKQLEKLSPSCITYKPAPSWDSQTETSRKQFAELNTVKQDLNKQGIAIQSISALLALEDTK